MEAKDTLWHIEWGDGDHTFVVAPDKESAKAKMSDGQDMIRYIVRHDNLYNLIYKAGYDKALNQLADMTEECKQMGRKEVVEWIEENSISEETAHESHMSSGEFFLGINPEDWQEQKKKWGL